MVLKFKNEAINKQKSKFTKNKKGKHKAIRGRPNELAKALEKLNGLRLGNAIHVHSGKKPTLWAIRNIEFYASKQTKEIKDDYWIPLDPLSWSVR